MLFQYYFRTDIILVVSVIQELFRRDAVKKVLSGMDEETLLQFLVSLITNPKSSAVRYNPYHGR